MQTILPYANCNKKEWNKLSNQRMTTTSRPPMTITKKFTTCSKLCWKMAHFLPGGLISRIHRLYTLRKGEDEQANPGCNLWKQTRCYIGTSSQQSMPCKEQSTLLGQTKDTVATTGEYPSLPLTSQNCKMLRENTARCSWWGKGWRTTRCRWCCAEQLGMVVGRSAKQELEIVKTHRQCSIQEVIRKCSVMPQTRFDTEDIVQQSSGSCPWNNPGKNRKWVWTGERSVYQATSSSFSRKCTLSTWKQSVRT